MIVLHRPFQTNAWNVKLLEVGRLFFSIEGGDQLMVWVGGQFLLGGSKVSI